MANEFKISNYDIQNKLERNLSCFKKTTVTTFKINGSPLTFPQSISLPDLNLPSPDNGLTQFYPNLHSFAQRGYIPTFGARGSIDVTGKSRLNFAKGTLEKFDTLIYNDWKTTYDFTGFPNEESRFIYVCLVGAGGGGGSSRGLDSGCGGGAGGAYVLMIDLKTVTSGYANFILGNGGSCTSNGSNGTKGGSTEMQSGAGSFYRAQGGNGGGGGSAYGSGGGFEMVGMGKGFYVVSSKNGGNGAKKDVTASNFSWEVSYMANSFIAGSAGSKLQFATSGGTKSTGGGGGAGVYGNGGNGGGNAGGATAGGGGGNFKFGTWNWGGRGGAGKIVIYF